ncbi:MAG: tRNA 2-selenouridine(34) synthase MnmH [Synechococcus sp. ChBW.bin.23]
MSGMGSTNVSGIDQFRAASGTLVDVRTPSEFAQGHWPGAINIPLFGDEQRAIVGRTYKQKGRKQAIELGLSFTGPALVDLSKALTKAAGGPDQPLRLYCWRGGMRSNSMAWLAALKDHPTLVLEGGYKVYRRWVLEQFERRWPVQLLGGRTGTGKTDLLIALQALNVAVVDLEGLAHHRGSSFGGLGQPNQPSTEHYENGLAEALDGYRKRQAPQIWLEAESSSVGCCRIPKALFEQMQQAPVLEIRRKLEERIDQLVEVYACQDPDQLRQATERIQRRLGPQRTQAALEAIKDQRWRDACSAMLDYYDRCYDHDLKQARETSNLDLSGRNAQAAAIELLNTGRVVAIDAP